MTEGEWFQKVYAIQRLYTELYLDNDFGFISCDLSSIHLRPECFLKLFGNKVCFKYHDIPYPVRAYTFVNDIEFFAIMTKQQAKDIFGYDG